MRLPGPHPRSLTFCSNAFGANGLQAKQALLLNFFGRLRTNLVGAGEPMTAGMWFDQCEVIALHQDAALRSDLAAAFHQQSIHPISLNVFPQGDFQAPIVKARVYEPDWSTPERRDHTLRAAVVLADLLAPLDRYGTLSTLPLGYREGRADLDLALHGAERIADVIEALARLRQESGREIVLAIEPEPRCALETAVDLIEWLEIALFPAMSKRSAIDGEAPELYARRHVGACLDTCHHAVVFEGALSARERYRRAGIRIAKIQISSALHIDLAQRPQIDCLKAFVEPRFLHQVAARDADGKVQLFTDLPSFLEAIDTTKIPWLEARCHFHVPIHEPRIGGLATTQADLQLLLKEEAKAPSTQHYEVETYTHSVLPGATIDPLPAIAEELRTARRLLAP